METKSKQLHQSVFEVNKDVKATKEFIIEIEKSLTEMAKQEEFRKPTKSLKHKQLHTEDEVLKTFNTYEQLHVDDDEVTFKNAETGSENEVLIIGIDPQQSSSTTKNLQLNAQNKESPVTMKDLLAREESSREATVDRVVKAIELKKTEKYATNTKKE